MSNSEPKSWALVGFSSPAFAIAALGIPIAAILPPLYAELGLSLTVVGAVFMLARFFDSFTDPLFGVLGDRFNTRWGKRRPAILLSLPILLYGVYRVFMPDAPATDNDLLISMLIMYVGWTIYTLAHTAWASELSNSYDGRSRVMSYLQYFGLGGSVVIMFVPLLVDAFVDGATMVLRAEMMGWLILAALPILTLIAFVSMPERLIVESVQPPWQDTWKIFVNSAALRRLLLADLLVGLQGGLNGAVHFFFIIHVLLLPKSASLFLVVLFVSGLLCVPIFLKLSLRFSKHRALCLGAIQSSCATALLFVVPAEAFWFSLLIYTLIGVNFGASSFLMRSMMADIVDQDRVATGAERSALFYSILTLTPKLGAALAIGMVYPLLDWVGFVPGGVNTSETIEGVRMIVALAPTLVTIVVALVMWNYPMDREAQSKIRAQLDQRS